MQKLTFQRNKYGKEILIDTVDTSEFAVDKMEVLPNFYTLAFLRNVTGQIKINNQTILLNKNTVIFIPVSQLVDISKANFIDGYFIFFEGEFLDKFLNEQNFIFKFSFFHNTDNPLYLQIDNSQKANIYSLFEECFPTMYFSDTTGKKEMVYGAKPYGVFESALLNLFPAATKTSYDKTWNALFTKYNTLTAKEFSELTGIERNKSEQFLNDLTTNGKLEKLTTKNGAIWMLKNTSR